VLALAAVAAVEVAPAAGLTVALAVEAAVVVEMSGDTAVEVAAAPGLPRVRAVVARPLPTPALTQAGGPWRSRTCWECSAP